MPVWGLHYMGSSYSLPHPSEAEQFHSVKHAKEVMESRYEGYDPVHGTRTPAMGHEGNEMHIFAQHPLAAHDPERDALDPDRVLTMGRHGRARQTYTSGTPLPARKGTSRASTEEVSRATRRGTAPLRDDPGNDYLANVHRQARNVMQHEAAMAAEGQSASWEPAAPGSRPLRSDGLVPPSTAASDEAWQRHRQGVADIESERHNPYGGGTWAQVGSRPNTNAMTTPYASTAAEREESPGEMAHKMLVQKGIDSQNEELDAWQTIFHDRRKK